MAESIFLPKNADGSVGYVNTNRDDPAFGQPIYQNASGGYSYTQPGAAGRSETQVALSKNWDKGFLSTTMPNKEAAPLTGQTGSQISQISPSSQQQTPQQSSPQMQIGSQQATQQPIDYTFNPQKETIEQYNQRIAAARGYDAGKMLGVPNAQQPQQGAPTGQNAINPTGSIVDTLKLAGMDSSFAARQQLAQQYGIQGTYTGSASQNIELEKKFVEAFNKAKNTTTPASAAEARSAIPGLMTGADNAVQNPVQSFYSAYGSMDPVTANLFDSINNIVSTINNRTSLVQEMQPYLSELQGLNADLMDLNRIMDGTEDDLREEITMAGGFATESQVRALAGARNKTLLKQANALSDQIALKQDWVNSISRLTEADRKQVDADLDKMLGISQLLYGMQEKMNNAAQDNYKAIVNEVGYGGLASMMGGNYTEMAKAEKALGLAPGSLSNPNFLDYAAKQQGGAAAKPQIVGSASSGYYAVSFDENGQPTAIPIIGGTGGGEGGSYDFTTTQTNKGAANANLSVADFKKLDPDVQNFYVNMSPTTATGFKKTLAEVVSGEQSPQEVKDYIASFGLADPVNEYLTAEVDKRAPAEQPSTWSKVKNWLGF